MSSLISVLGGFLEYSKRGTDCLDILLKKAVASLVSLSLKNHLGDNMSLKYLL